MIFRLRLHSQSIALSETVEFVLIYFICRSFFACMFFVVVLLSIYFISNVWMKWTASPIIITLNSKSTFVKDLPFPGKNGDFYWNNLNWRNNSVDSTCSLWYCSWYFFYFKAVTICNMHQVKKSAMQKYPKDSVEYSVIRSMCRHDFYYYENDTNAKPATWTLFRKLLLEVCIFFFHIFTYFSCVFQCW